MTDMTTARAFPGRHFPGQGRSLSTFSMTPPLDTLIAIPFETAGEFDAIIALVRTPDSGDAVMRGGIYDSGPDGLPDALVEDCGEHSLAFSQPRFVEMMFSTPITLSTPYWVVALFGGTTAPAMQGTAAIPSAEAQKIFGINSGNLDGGIFSPTSANAVTAAFSYAALPATFPTPSLGGSTLWLSVRSTV